MKLHTHTHTQTSASFFIFLFQFYRTFLRKLSSFSCYCLLVHSSTCCLFSCPCICIISSLPFVANRHMRYIRATITTNSQSRTEHLRHYGGNNEFIFGRFLHGYVYVYNIYNIFTPSFFFFHGLQFSYRVLVKSFIAY